MKRLFICFNPAILQQIRQRNAHKWLLEEYAKKAVVCECVCLCIFRIRGIFDKMTCIHASGEKSLCIVELSCFRFLHSGRNAKRFRKIDPNTHFFQAQYEQFQTKFEERKKRQMYLSR